LRTIRPNFANTARALTLCLIVTAGLPASAGTITPDLRDALVSAGPDDRVPVVVMMEEYPARAELMREVRGLNRESRRHHVVSRLRALSRRTQQPVRAVLADLQDETRRVRVLWGVNAVALEATPYVIARLAELPEVRWVSHDGGSGQPANGADTAGPPLSGTGTPAGGSVTTGPTGGDTSGPNPDATVRGEVIAMGAQQVWEQLGYTGVGVIVAVIDTGVYPDTLDVADHIWTNLDEVPDNGLDDDGNGYVDDTWGWDFCNDDNEPISGNHGTQVATQVAGDGTDGVVTGMAPDAELMVLGIDCAPPDSIGWEASDYAIANGAQIITESFIWPWTTDTPDFEGWRRQTDAQLAAGVIHSSAAGNDGNDPSLAVPYNVSAPANSPPPWLHPDQTLVGGVSSTISVANIVWSTDVIAASSSIGPSAWEDIVVHTDPEYPHPLTPEYMDYPYENGVKMGLLKPDISAYGNGTMAQCPGDYYCSFSGTSSATPHVAGVLALMLQSNPEATPAELTQAILTTAQHRGDPGKNNVYGTGLVQAYDAVLAVESGVVYSSHSIDDSAAGNGDGMLDPGERVEMQVTVESRATAAIEGLEAILSTSTPGVTIHKQHVEYPTLPADGMAVNDAPDFSLSIDAATCTSVISFDLELRYAGSVRRSVFQVRVGDLATGPMLSDDFESDLGWTADPGTATDGFWVREDPIGKQDSQSRPTNPEDDTSDPGTTCWVTGNASGGNADGDDVDGGRVVLSSPPFGELHVLSLGMTYDRWFYDNESSGNYMWIDVSNNGGLDWTNVETIVYGYGGWQAKTADLLALITPTDDMRLRVVVEDGGTDGTLEGAIDEVHVDGVWGVCQDYTSPTALAPNPVGNTLRIEADPRGHTVLIWDAPVVDGSHDAATVYYIERATSPAGPFTDAGSATTTRWIGVDALGAADSFYYRVRAENAGGSE
jgi:subtilisin family serine protease